MLDEKFFAEHAISMEVAEARPYVYWSQGDYEPVLSDHQRFVDRYFTDEPSKEWKKVLRQERKHLRSIVSQSDGYIICRHAYGGRESRGFVHTEGLLKGFLNPHNPAVPSELRPNKPVLTDPRRHWHYHGELSAKCIEFLEWTKEKGPRPPMPADWPRIPTSNKPLPRALVHRAENMQRHISKREKDGLVNAHAGVNSNEVHWHQRRAKYVFLPGPSAKDREAGLDYDHAKRFDVHPLAFDRLMTCRRVYVVLEGCIKADAVLTAILATGEDASVISVPSVTLWDTDEFLILLYRFLHARRRGFLPELVIVPDADWHTNQAVRTQAFLCRSRLRRLGYGRTCIAAPPIEGVANGIKGVDDFLAAGSQLGDLVVLDREPPDYSLLLDLRGLYAQKRDNCIQMLTALAEHADEQDGFEGSIEKAGRIAGMKKTTAWRVLKQYLIEDLGLIHVDDRSKLLLKPRKWVPKLRREVGEFDWEDQPRFTLPQHLRAEMKLYPLREWSDKVAYELEPLAAPRSSTSQVFPSLAGQQSAQGGPGLSPRLGSPPKLGTNGKMQKVFTTMIEPPEPTLIKEPQR